jgi:hypothetical protein
MARRTADERAEAEQEQMKQFEAEQGRWRRGRTRDVVAARHLLIEMNELLGQGLAARGVELLEVFDDLAKTRQLTGSMPSSAIVTSTTARHRNRNLLDSERHLRHRRDERRRSLLRHCRHGAPRMPRLLKTARVEQRANPTLRQLGGLTSFVDRRSPDGDGRPAGDAIRLAYQWSHSRITLRARAAYARQLVESKRRHLRRRASISASSQTRSA